MTTVKDLIEHLQTLPQDMEVWGTWDESGEAWLMSCAADCVRVSYVCKHKTRLTRKGLPWWGDEGPVVDPLIGKRPYAPKNAKKVLMV